MTVRVVRGFKINTHRCSKQLEFALIKITEIASIGVWHAVGLISVNHNDRWVRPTLVGIAHLDSATSNQGWLMLLSLIHI